MAALAAHGPHMTHGHHFQPYPSVSMGPIWGFKVRLLLSFPETWALTLPTFLSQNFNCQVVCYSRGRTSFCFRQTWNGSFAKSWYAFPNGRRTTETKRSKIVTHNSRRYYGFPSTPKQLSTEHVPAPRYSESFRIFSNFELFNLKFSLCLGRVDQTGCMYKWRIYSRPKFNNSKFNWKGALFFFYVRK